MQTYKKEHHQRALSDRFKAVFFLRGSGPSFIRRPSYLPETF
jgi:hypothetical protein